MKAALYHRVSTVDQNPELARDELRAAAARYGFDIAVEIEETGSGANNDRPGLQQILADAKKKKFDAVLVWKLDRFGRSALDLLANIRHLEECKVRFIATTQSIDIRPGGDPMGRLLLTMLAAVAEFERDLIRERTKLGIARAKAKGKAVGRPSTTDGLANEIKALRATGYSWMEIAHMLDISSSSARRAAAKEHNSEVSEGGKAGAGTAQY